MNLSNNLHKSVLDKLKEWKNSPLQFVKECIKATPTEQQIELLQAFPKEKRMSVRSGHGCFAVNTIVHTYPYGFEFVQNIKIGNFVMGPDSTPRKVLQLFNGTAPMYRVSYSNGTYYDVNESHLLAVINTKKGSRFKFMGKYNIPIKEYIKLPKTVKAGLLGYKAEINYPELPVLIPPYILGVWLGDGNSLRPSITNVDKEILGEWQLWGESLGLEMYNTEDGIQYNLRHANCSNKNIILDFLRHYNLVGNKHIPKEYLFNSREVRLELLAGLLDTDGSAQKQGGGYQFVLEQAREDIANDVVFLAQSLGIHASMSTRSPRPVKSTLTGKEYMGSTQYVVILSRGAEKIPVRVKRKQAPLNYKSHGDNRFKISVDCIGEGEYFGFEVDKDNLFILDDFTVVHNCGKDTVVSWLAINFLTTRPYAKVVVTAPTNRQLRDIFLAEISKWLRQSTVADEFVIHKDSVVQKDASKEWWLRLISPSVRSTKEEQAETLAGLHGEHLLIICDEASGIPDPTFIPLEGAMTQPDNKSILIGNPTRNSGYFYDTHFNSVIKNDWFRLHWDSRLSTNVDKSMPEYFARKYGVESNIFRIRVEGNPPLQDDTTLIPLWAAEQCIGNEIEVAEDEPLYLGVDVARYGDDSSIILPRQGLRIDPWETYRKLNTIDLGGFIMQSYQEMNASGCAIDVIGVGAGVFDWLEKHRLKNLFGVNVSLSSSDICKYHRLRDELWCRVRDKCLLGLYSFPAVKLHGEEESLGQQLASELASVRYKFNQHGGIVVESKKDLKVRGISSPNIADGLGLTEYFSNTATRVFAKDKGEEFKHRNYRNDLGNFQQAWMR